MPAKDARRDSAPQTHVYVFSANGPPGPSLLAGRPVDDPLARHLLGIGLRHALARGLRGDDAEDSASGYVLHVLSAASHGAGPTAPDRLPAWLECCAGRWTTDYARRNRSVHQHEVAAERETNHHARLRARGPGGLPDAQALDGELHRRIIAAASELAPGDQHLFVRRFLRDASYTQIADETGRSPASVRAAVSGMRRRLCARLARTGLDESEAREYLRLAAGARGDVPEPREEPDAAE